VVKHPNINGVRDVLDADDAASAAVKVAINGVAGEVYNIGRGQGVQLKDVLNKLVSLSVTKEIKLEEVISTEPATRLRGGYSSIVADVSKLKDKLSWSPSVSVVDSLQDELDHWRAVTKNLYPKEVGENEVKVEAVKVEEIKTEEAKSEETKVEQQ
jgi:GDP-4-dehydro-6-deoxy-D-mannose reductase